jgi:hypothetical protein
MIGAHPESVNASSPRIRARDATDWKSQNADRRRGGITKNRAVWRKENTTSDGRKQEKAGSIPFLALLTPFSSPLYSLLTPFWVPGSRRQLARESREQKGEWRVESRKENGRDESDVVRGSLLALLTPLSFPLSSLLTPFWVTWLKASTGARK